MLQKTQKEASYILHNYYNLGRQKIKGGIYSQGSCSETGGQGAPAVCMKKVQGKKKKIFFENKLQRKTAPCDHSGDE